MLLPHPGRPGVQCWDQRSLVTFALTGAVQPLTCCMVEFPPLGCTGRNLLSTNRSSFFIPLRALDWEEGGGGNMPKQEGITLLPPLCSCAPAAQAAKKASLVTPRQGVDAGSQRGGEPVPAFFSHSTTGPAKPTKSWHSGWKRGGDGTYQAEHCGV